MECARKGATDCDLPPFSPAKWSRIWKKRNEKAKEAKEALAKFTRLQREVEALERKGIEIVEGTVADINDAEVEEAPEATEASSPSPSDFLFNVASEELVLEDDFNQSAVLGSSFGTGIESQSK